MRGQEGEEGAKEGVEGKKRPERKGGDQRMSGWCQGGKEDFRERGGEKEGARDERKGPKMKAMEGRG